MERKKVIVGLSGGVDSAVAAYVLKKQGLDVHAVFMINWHDTAGLRSGSCESDEDQKVAELVAHQLDIPFHTVDFSEIYAKKVVDYIFSEYEKGRTPNPDVLCNREIKFDVFLDKALELGADYVATGHYCRKEEIQKNGKTYYRLLAGSDPNKDQSYFLCQLSQKQLEKSLFPVGDLQKPEVRRIADEISLVNAKKKDSQGICFVGKVDLPTFLQQQLKAKEGDIIKIPADSQQYHSPIPETDDEEELLRYYSRPYNYTPEMGEVAGRHSGAHFFTVGQRKGLGIGGMKEPPFVIDTDTKNNILYIGEGKQHPGLFRKGLFMEKAELHWVRPDLALKVGERLSVLSRIRYRQPLQKALLYMQAEGAYLIFEEKQRGITSGQFAAFYLDDELIGSGVISGKNTH
jgi:tRNA-uridine 2-sulfurtransferase